jgi:dipeptidyl aminopeptidase/acylaminoacyl peptidase
VLAILIAACAFAQPVSELTLQLDATVVYRDIAISPDGGRLAWVQSTAAGSDAAVYRILGNEPNAKPVRLRTESDGDRRDSSPAWSPDGKSLAFLSDGQIWVAAAKSADAHKRTSLDGYVDRLRWSPDGKQIAFLYIEGAGGGGPLPAAPAQTGVIEAAIHNQRIAILDVASGTVRQASPADLHVYDFDWSPDGGRFVVTAAPGPGDNNWWIARIHVIDARTGVAKEIYRPSLQVATPRWSPDGGRIAFIEGLMSDEGFHGGEVYTIAAEGGPSVNHTPGRKSSPSSVRWISDERLLFTEWTGGGSAVSTVELSSGASETLWSGDYGIHADGVLPSFVLARDGRTSAIVHESFTEPPEVWAGPIGDWKPVTRNNEGLRPSWGRAENLEWESDGHRVQGWLLPPKLVETGRRYPMVVSIHGGPSGSETPSWPAGFSLPAVLASRGYYVLFPNPRGSYGQGEEFTRANVKDFGGGDLRDILKGVDHSLAHYPIDPNRLGVTGWSYGGYMTMWTVTQTQRFRAAMAGAGIANWQSYYGENLIDQWMIPFFGATVYDNPAVYAKSSPITFIRNVKTPTLVVVGERDAECPAPQSFEFWHALKTLGVPTELVVYAGEGHRFDKAANRADFEDRTVAWFDKYLTP